MRTRIKNIVVCIVMLLTLLVMLFPLWSIIISSFSRDGEVHFWITEFSFSQYWELLSGSSGYFYLFFRSFVIAVIITVLQCMVSIPFGFLAGRFRFKGKLLLILLYSMIMLLPYSATLLPNYMMIRDMGLLNTQLSIILPAVFSPLGGIIMTIFISVLPQDVIDAALLETNRVTVLLKDILIPQVRHGIALTMMISFTEAWNMVEQPQAMMNQTLLQPLSAVLSNIFTKGNVSIGSAAGIFLYILPPLLLLWSCRDILNDSIFTSKRK